MKKLITLPVLLLALTTSTLSSQITIDTIKFDWLLKRHNDAVLFEKELENCDSVYVDMLKQSELKIKRIAGKDSVISIQDSIISIKDKFIQECSSERNKLKKKVTVKNKIILVESIILTVTILFTILLLKN